MPPIPKAEYLSKCAWLMECLFEAATNGLVPNVKMLTALKFEYNAGRAFPYGYTSSIVRLNPERLNTT